MITLKAYQRKKPIFEKFIVIEYFDDKTQKLNDNLEICKESFWDSARTRFIQLIETNQYSRIELIVANERGKGILKIAYDDENLSKDVKAFGLTIDQYKEFTKQRIARIHTI